MRRYGSVAVTCVLLALSACHETQPSGARLGVLMPLTGSAASLGVPATNAIKLAVAQYESTRRSSGDSIFLHVEDTQAQPAVGVSALQKLISVDHIQAVIGPLTSTVTLAVAPIAQEDSVILISPGASAPKISTAGDFIFRNELSDLEGGRMQARLAVDSLGFRRVAIVYINTDYGVGLMRVFRSTFDSLGGTVPLDEAFAASSTDFRSILTKIENAKVDAILFIGIDEVVPFVRQKAELGITVPLYTTPIFENKRYVDELGPLADGILYVYYGQFNPAAPDSLQARFITAYRTKFGQDPTYYSALAYDATRLYLRALDDSRAEDLTTRDALARIRNFPGVTGPTSFNANGDVTKPVVLKTVKDGKFVFYHRTG